jgi:hypothetical protein
MEDRVETGLQTQLLGLVQLQFMLAVVVVVQAHLGVVVAQVERVAVEQEAQQERAAMELMVWVVAVVAQEAKVIPAATAALA